MRFLLFLGVLALFGCVGVPPLDNSESRATLEFAKPEGQRHAYWYFASVDGHRLKSVPKTIGIQPGVRTIGYYCAVWLDGPPPTELSMDFNPGKIYIFHCMDNYHAQITEK